MGIKGKKNSQPRKENILRHPLVVALLTVVVGLFFQWLYARFIEPSKIEPSEIINLAEKAMWGLDEKEQTGGDNAAYEELLKIKAKLKNQNDNLADFVEGQIEKVRSNYRNVDMVLTFPPIIMPAGEQYYYFALQLETRAITGHAFSQNPWYTHAKAAYLLRFRPEKSIPDNLIKLMDSSSSLLVRKVALDSFCLIAKYEKGNILDFDGARGYWKQKKELIIRDLKDDGTVPAKEGQLLTLEEINRKFGSKIINIKI